MCGIQGCRHTAGLGGGVDVFYLGRHGLKTYVCVQESSRKAMLVRAGRETLLYKS